MLNDTVSNRRATVSIHVLKWLTELSKAQVWTPSCGLGTGKKALFTGLFDGTTDEVAFERSGSFLSRIERIVAPAPAPVQTRDAVAAPEDDAAEREIGAVVAAGDESRDAPGAATPGAGADPIGR